jgi:hypothetical protein
MDVKRAERGVSAFVPLSAIGQFRCKRSRGSALYTVNPGQVGFTTMQKILHSPATVTVYADQFGDHGRQVTSHRQNLSMNERFWRKVPW